MRIQLATSAEPVEIGPSRFVPEGLCLIRSGIEAVPRALGSHCRPLHFRFAVRVRMLLKIGPL